MRRTGKLCALLALILIGASAATSFAAPLITTVAETGTGLNANAAIATSASSPSAGAEPSAALVDEAFAMTNRTHEYTAVRTDAGTGALTTAAAGNLQPFPAYLVGLEYVQIANDNRTVANYSLDLTFSQPVKAYLFMDNRNNGGGAGDTSNTTDPVLEGTIAWVAADGWARVNTGFMPNGAPDYIGIDEGATVAAGVTARSHAVTANLIAGSGNGLNNFYAIYTKNFTAGAHVGVGKVQGQSTNIYGVAVAVIPEPGSAALALLAAGGGLMARRKRR